MKKVLMILCAMVLSLSCFALAGCGSGGSGDAPPADSQYIGTWKAVSAEFKGEEADIDEVLNGQDFIITLNDDGTATVSSSDTNGDGTWSETDKGFKVTGDDIDMEFEVTDGVGTFSILGVNLRFEKQ